MTIYKPIKPIAVAMAAIVCAALASNLAAAEPGSLGGVDLAQISLPSRDLERSVHFYRETLGLKLLFRVNGAVFFELPGMRLRLEMTEKAPSTAGTLYFNDPGLSRSKSLAARGVRFVGPPETVRHSADGDLQIQEFADPDGNNLAIMGTVSHSP